MTRQVSSAAGLILVVALWVTRLEAAAPMPMPPGQAALNELLASAYVEGSVRVIVKLTAAGILPEADLSHDSFAVAVQRSKIADHQNAAMSALAGTRHRILWRYQTSPFLALHVSPDALRALAASPLVESIVQDVKLSALLSRTGPLVQADTTQAAGITGSNQAVVIIDSGVDGTHPFLSGRILEEWCFGRP
jgi:hypothetical protein